MPFVVLFSVINSEMTIHRYVVSWSKLKRLFFFQNLFDNENEIKDAMLVYINVIAIKISKYL